MMLAAVRQWFRREFRDPFTVACDYSPFRIPGLNEWETLFHTRGRRKARRIARRWVRRHQSGQARVLNGTLTFSA